MHNHHHQTSQKGHSPIVASDYCDTDLSPQRCQSIRNTRNKREVASSFRCRILFLTKVIVVLALFLGWKELDFVLPRGLKSGNEYGMVDGQSVNGVKKDVGLFGDETKEKVATKTIRATKEEKKEVEKDVKEVEIQKVDPLHFVSFYYPERNKGWDQWRLNGSSIVVPKNDHMLQKYGGLTVFTVPEAVDLVKTWNVSKIFVIQGIEDKCRNRTTGSQNELCPKKVMMTEPQFMDLKHVVFLDTDAQIVDPKYMEKIKYYRHFADFAAVPDHTAWDSLKYQEVNTEYNTGAFYMRTQAFNNPKFIRFMLDSCHSTREQTCITKYVKDNSDSLYVEMLPWIMHCRGKYYGPNCLLIHNWGNAARYGLNWVLNNWEEHLKSI